MTRATDVSTLGRNLRDARERRGWSRATLARHSNTSDATIARAELYGALPGLAIVQAWASALGVGVGELLDPAPPEPSEAAL